MSFFSRLFRPANSIILVYDHISHETEEELSLQLDEISRFYRWVKLSELSLPEKKYREGGVASVVFREPRRSAVLRGAPQLRNRGIPFTLMADAATVGTNRLSFADEVELYAKYFSPRGLNLSQLRETYFRSPDEARIQLNQMRAAHGPLPLDKLDPTFFSSTWGQLVELSDSEVEFGVCLDRDPRNADMKRDVEFVRGQLGRPVTSAFLRGEFSVDASSLAELRLQTLVVERYGMVRRNATSLNLPQFQFEKA